MKKKIFQVTTVIMLVITLTMANFVLLGVNIASYAAEAINGDGSTSHKNVEFMAYFKDENANKVSNKEVTTNEENLKLYVQVSVKNQGYFNGNITVDTANFKLKTDLLSSDINKIEGNTVYLNQIKAGETKEIQLAIELLKDDDFDLSLLKMDSKVSIKGIYRDSTEKDISISATKTVQLKLVSPYNKDNTGSKLSQEVITNKVLNYNGEDKKILQIQVNSGIDQNLFPIKSSSLKITAPKISNKYPEKVLVNTIDVLSTNGKQISQDNWNYNSETGLINISLENNAVDNKVKWMKTGEDIVVITYIFDNTTSKIENQKSLVDTEIKLHDLNNTIITASSEIGIKDEEKNGIITVGSKQEDEKTYKGKLYSNIQKDVTYTTSLNVKLTDVANNINILEEKEKIQGEGLETDINSIYKNSKIRKSELQDILGEDGNLIILNAETEEQIALIANDYKADDNGYINIQYSNNVKQVKFVVSQPKNVGRINIETTKTINSIDKDIVKKCSNIKYSVNGEYQKNTENVKLEEAVSNVQLQETETSAKLELPKTNLSTINTNKEFEIDAVLESRDDKNELFKNPVIKVELPEKVENIENIKIDLLNEDELKIVSSKLNGKTIEVQLSGEQTKYKNEAIEGATIRIIADLTINKKTSSSLEKIKMSYTNENVINYKNLAKVGEDEKDINIVSYVGIVTSNKISDYGIEVINNDGNKTGKINLSEESKETNIENEIINNQESQISNVKVLGIFPTRDAVKDINNIDVSINSSISLQGIDANRVQVYYSNNVNATNDLNDSSNLWTNTIEDTKNVKKYLIVIDKLDVYEKIDFSYKIGIPSNLDYNQIAEEGYNIYYTNSKTSIEEKAELDNLRLETGKGPVADTNLKALIGGLESKEVKEGSFISYVITVTNNGTENISNVKMIGNVPENTIYVEPKEISHEMGGEDKDVEPFTEYPEKQNVEINIDNLSVGESISKTYQVKVKTGTDGKQISNVVTTTYGEVTKKSNEVTNTIKKGELELTLYSPDTNDGNLKNGYFYRYVVGVKNSSNTEKKNVKLEVNVGDSIELQEIHYTTSDNNSISEKQNNYITIANIEPGEKIEIAAVVQPKEVLNSGTTKASILAKATADSETYYSNNIDLVTKPINLETSIISDNSNGYVKSGDTIVYNIKAKNNGNSEIEKFMIKNTISNKVTLLEIDKSGKALETSEYTIEKDLKTSNQVINLTDKIEAGETNEYQIKVIVNKIPGNTASVEIINTTKLSADSVEIANKNITHILTPEENSDNKDTDNPDDTDDSDSNGSDSEDGNYIKRVISGLAWLDEDSNGEKGENEKLLEGITVKLLNTKTNEFTKNSKGEELTVTTNSNGFYSFDSVSKGEYIVVFEYDTSKYILTTYKKQGIDSQNNSKAINKTMSVNGEDKTVGITDTIEIDSTNISNMNIGLQTAKNFDLKLDKYIGKVVVQNSKGTITNEYEDATLAKAEIDAKKVNGTTVVVEYKIKVTNNGEIDAYVKKIEDDLSKDYKFSSELNKDWYQSGDTLYNASLANEKLKPGESKEIKLIVTKQMTENNTGLVNNTAKIAESYNELGLVDNDTTGSADLYLSIKTGQIVTTITLILSTIIIVGAGAYMIGKIVINRKII